MSPKDLIDYFRSPTAVARALGIKPPSVYGWMSNGRVPIDRQCQAEIVTAGALRADRTELGMQPAASGPTQQQAAHQPRRGQMR